jgi:uncharacterized protein (TIGR02453 family)
MLSETGRRDHSFNGFPQAGLDFLRALKRHNTREWFVPRKQVYEGEVRLPTLQLVADLTSEMWAYAPEHTVEPARAVYRVNRDTRFGEDKSPYKTHVAAIFPHRLLGKSAGASFYFNVSPEQVEVAAGIYTPESSELRLIRQRLLTEHRRFEEVIRRVEDSQLAGSLQGGTLKRGPRGFPEEHPAAEQLRRKAFYFDVRLPSATAASRQLFDELSKLFRLLAPLVLFLDECLVTRTSPPARTPVSLHH